jgi:hypothetical protein
MHSFWGVGCLPVGCLSRGDGCESGKSGCTFICILTVIHPERDLFIRTIVRTKAFRAFKQHYFQPP